MKSDDLRDLNNEQLHARASEIKESLFRLKFKLALGNTDVIKNLRAQKKDLARVKTLLRERELSEEKTAAS